MTRSAPVRRGLAASLVVLVLAGPALAEPAAKIVSQKAAWEIAYGLVLHRVIGEVENVSSKPIPYVHLKVEWLAADGTVVHAMDAFNQRAEPLGMVEAEARKEMLATIEPLGPGEKELFRVAISKDEIPKEPRFVLARARIVEPEADPASVVPDLPKHEPPAADAVNVNEASREELLTLPGMTEARAVALLHHIEKNGPVVDFDELGIIPQLVPILEEIRPRIRVD